MKHYLIPVVLVMAALTSNIALADANSDLQQAAAAFNAQKSFHADEHFSNGDFTQVDYIPTDKIRVNMTNHGMEDVIIGNDFWVSNKGKWSKLPSFAAQFVTAKVAQFRHLFPDVAASSVKDLGMQSVDGKMLHAYSFVSGGAPATMWLDAHHLPQKAVTSSQGITTTITYAYNNVSIDPPQ